MFHLYRKKSIIFFITIVNSLKLAKGSLQPIVLPSLSEPKSSNVYEFTPLATIIGFAFIAICFLLLAIAKIMFASSDQYMMNNRYDLVIFKAPTKNTVMGPRRVYANNAANAHNLTAAKSCGFDVSLLNSRSSYNALLAGLGTPSSK